MEGVPVLLGAGLIMIKWLLRWFIGKPMVYATNVELNGALNTAVQNQCPYIWWRNCDSYMLKMILPLCLWMRMLDRILGKT
jgi:hypothetical protein